MIKIIDLKEVCESLKIDCIELEVGLVVKTKVEGLKDYVLDTIKATDYKTHMDILHSNGITVYLNEDDRCLMYMKGVI